MTATQAASISLIPIGAFLFIGEATVFGPFCLGVSVLFVGGVTLIRLSVELVSPTISQKPLVPRFGPRGYLSQAEAREKLEDMMMKYWEGE